MYQNNKVIVLAEPNWSKGHFETQMYLFLSILLPKECRIIVLCSEPDKISAWAVENLPEYKEKVFAAHFSAIDEAGKKKLKAGRIWQHLSKAIEKAVKDSGWGVDLVCITFLDTIVNNSWRTLGFRPKFDYPWVGIYFLPRFLRCKTIDLKIFLQWVSFQNFCRIKGCRAIGILDDGIYAEMKSQFRNRDIFIFPDVTDERLPVHTPEKITQIRESAGQRPIIGLVGLLQKRKGLLNFLRSVQNMGHTDYFLLVAGYLPAEKYSRKDYDEIMRLLSSYEKNDCFYDLNYIDDPLEVNAYIALCDVLYLGYERFYHSSGFMTKAAVFRKPMIVTKGFCMGERVEKYRLGLTVAEGDCTEISKAVRILSDEETRKQIVSEARFDSYLNLHSLEKLETTLCAMLGVEFQ